MIYNSIYLVKHPVKPDRFMVGIDAFTEYDEVLDNGRVINVRRLVFINDLNPWAYKGAQLGKIMEFFLEEKNHRKNKHIIHPLWKRKKAIHIQALWDEPRDRLMTFDDIREDFKLAVKMPVSLADDEPFGYIPGKKATWKERFLEKQPPKTIHIKSDNYMCEAVTTSIIMKPYYVIKTVANENVYVSGTCDGTEFDFEVNTLHNAMQFKTDSQAFRYIEDYSNLFEDGFEIVELPPPMHFDTLSIMTP